jgi:hypothetical protein
VEDYFSADGHGGLLDRYRKRAVLVNEDFIVGLQKGLEKEVDDVAPIIMYKCGYQWGLEDMKNFDTRFAQEFEWTTMRKMNTEMVLETWWWPLQVAGWGAWGFDFSHKKQGLIFVDLYNSAIAQSIGNVGKVVCHFYAGLFAGVFTYLTQKELNGIEIQCYSMGESYCKFLLGSEKKVNAADFWVQEGAKAEEILAKVMETVID